MKCPKCYAPLFIAGKLTDTREIVYCKRCKYRGFLDEIYKRTKN
jgi:predicted nucleic-acid-binding Zn-ribbon protein